MLIASKHADAALKISQAPLQPRPIIQATRPRSTPFTRASRNPEILCPAPRLRGRARPTSPRSPRQPYQPSRRHCRPVHQAQAHWPELTTQTSGHFLEAQPAQTIPTQNRRQTTILPLGIRSTAMILTVHQQTVHCLLDDPTCIPDPRASNSSRRCWDGSQLRSCEQRRAGTVCAPRGAT